MYDELIKRLRVSCGSCKLWDGYKCCLKGECSAQKSLQAADVIEDLQKQLQKSEEDNVNLTGWLAEEHANKCPYYIRNVHDRGDDSMCKKYLCEVKDRKDLKLKQSLWIPVTERLPLGNNLVLAVANGEVVIAIYGNYKWTEAKTYAEIYPTHWMPLPESPESEGTK